MPVASFAIWYDFVSNRQFARWVVMRAGFRFTVKRREADGATAPRVSATMSKLLRLNTSPYNRAGGIAWGASSRRACVTHEDVDVAACTDITEFSEGIGRDAVDVAPVEEKEFVWGRRARMACPEKFEGARE